METPESSNRRYKSICLPCASEAECAAWGTDPQRFGKYRRQVFAEVGGLDKGYSPINFNDVDFCLRIREKGYRNLWTPYAELYQWESASRGNDGTSEKRARVTKEVTYLQQRWQALLLNDSAYNPNLTLEQKDSSLAFPPRVRKPWYRLYRFWEVR